ncbi:MAG: hypothetical protein AB7K24_05940 [Gemmataceae bacterium]
MIDDLWDWFVEKELEYEEEGDQERLAMASLHADAFELGESNPQGMLRMLKDGRARARRLGEPWWTYLYEVWIAMTYQDNLGDLRNGLTEALHCVNEGRKPALQGHPWRIAAHNTLLAAYIDVDPLGYAQAIEACIKELSREIPRNSFEHRYVMLEHQRTYLLICGRYQQARRIALRALNLFERDFLGDDWYVIHAFLDLCLIAFHDRNVEGLLAAVEPVEEIARSHETAQLDHSEAQVWQAIAARLQGDEKRAKRLFRSASNRTVRLRKKPRLRHYEAIAAFHELGEDLERCLEVRDEQLAHIQNTGRFGYECDVRIKRCELLARLDRLKPRDLAKARDSLKPLKNPQPYRKRLDKLAGPGTRQRRA